MAIAYHDTVNDLPLPYLDGKGPFARIAWFRLLEEAGFTPFAAVANDQRGTIALPLKLTGNGLEVLTNWYAFTWAPLTTPDAPDSLLDDLTASLVAKGRIRLSKLPEAEADRLQAAFRAGGWRVRREVCDSNHFLPVQGRTFAQYLASRPGPLRTTLKRKARKVEVRLSRKFAPDDWATYEDIYRRSWKPEEGDPALLRRFAEQESHSGHYLFGLATANGEPVAAQFWTVEGGTAYIHKLAHLPEADSLSPGTTLTAALMEQVIDRDGVAEVDFGTGNDGYKADWMECMRPRYLLTCLRPGSLRNWPELANWGLAKLVSTFRAG